MNKKIDKEILEQVDESKRASVRKILAGGFVLPAIATLSMSTLDMKAANAAVDSDPIKRLPGDY